MSGLSDILRLIRVVNCILAMLAVGVGAYMTAPSFAYYGPLVTSLAVFCVCAAGNILNDILDIETDRINHPERVFVGETVTVRLGWYLFASFLAASLVLAIAVNLRIVALVAGAHVALAGYNLKLKRMPLVGNITVALLSGLTFLAGGWAVDAELAMILPGPLIAALFAFLIHLNREIVKDIQDMDGDRIARQRTLPMITGISRALLVVLGLFFLLVIATIYPILTGWYGGAYKIITLYLIDLPMLALLIFVWGNPTPAMLSAASLALKLVMGLGLIALILA